MACLRYIVGMPYRIFMEFDDNLIKIIYKTTVKYRIN